MIKLFHNLNEINAKIYATQSAPDVFKFIEDREEDVRIVYDTVNGWYYWALASFMVHPEFIYIGWQNGLYPDIPTEYVLRHDYILNNEFIYLYYYKDLPEKENITGDYGVHYYYDFGIIDSKDILRTQKHYFEETELYKLLEPRLEWKRKERTKKRKAYTGRDYLEPYNDLITRDF